MRHPNDDPRYRPLWDERRGYYRARDEDAFEPGYDARYAGLHDPRYSGGAYGGGIDRTYNPGPDAPRERRFYDDRRYYDGPPHPQTQRGYHRWHSGYGANQGNRDDSRDEWGRWDGWRDRGD